MNQWLASYREYGLVMTACKAASVGRATVVHWRERLPAFATLYDEAKEEAIDELEREAIRRAKDSSDRLLGMLLRANRPEKFSSYYDLPQTGLVQINVRLYGTGPLSPRDAGGSLVGGASSVPGGMGGQGVPALWQQGGEDENGDQDDSEAGERGQGGSGYGRPGAV